MSGFSCFLNCIQISQKAGQVVWYSHLFQNFPQFIVIHTIKGFGMVNKAEADVFSMKKAREVIKGPDISQSKSVNYRFFNVK